MARTAYDLLTAVEYLIRAVILILSHEDDGYIREKLHRALNPDYRDERDR